MMPKPNVAEREKQTGQPDGRDGDERADGNGDQRREQERERTTARRARA